MHLTTGGGQLLLETLQIQIKVGEGMILDRHRGIAERVELGQSFDRRPALERKALAEAASDACSLSSCNARLALAGNECAVECKRLSSSTVCIGSTLTVACRCCSGRGCPVRDAPPCRSVPRRPADGRRIVGHPGQHLRHMANAESLSFPAQSAGDVEQASHIAAEQRVCPRSSDCQP